MKKWVSLLSVLLGLLGFSAVASALPKASDFKEIGSEGDAEAGATTSGAVAGDEGAAAKSNLGENEQLVSGTVRIIRKIEMTEVFFKDLKDSYFIPSGSGYGAIYKACQESEKKGTAVGLKVNTKSRRILSVESSAAKSPASGAGSSSSTTGNK